MDSAIAGSRAAFANEMERLRSEVEAELVEKQQAHEAWVHEQQSAQHQAKSETMAQSRQQEQAAVERLQVTL